MKPTVDKFERVNTVPGELPADYHCDCEYCRKYLGLLIREDGTKYSKNDRRAYYAKEEISKAGEGETGGHIAKTPLHIARWAIQQYTKPGDWVLDPTIGAGTTAVEAITNGRRVVGVELQFADVLIANVKKALEDNAGNGSDAHIWQGDARFIEQIMAAHGFNEPISLIVNNPPYSGDESQKGIKRRDNFAYDPKLANLAFLREGSEYYETMRNIYKSCVDRLESGGHLVLGVKDMVRGKQPYMLHQYLCEIVAMDDRMEYVGMALLPHYPTTLFMNTYPKMHPDVKVPLYQTINVFRKK